MNSINLCSTEILNWLKVGYKKADGGNAPVLAMRIADQEGRGILRVDETTVGMATHSSVSQSFTRS